MMNGFDAARAREALFSLCAGCSRDEWVRAGMAAKAAGLSEDDFLEWSATGDNYGGVREARSVWKSIKADGGIGEGTPFKKAKDAGWRDAHPNNGTQAVRVPVTKPTKSDAPRKPRTDLAAMLDGYSSCTRTDYEQCSRPLLEVFGDSRASDIDATDIAKYLRAERAAAPVRANREIALLSNLIGLAIERGEAKHNPCREVRRNEEQPRTEAPEPEDFAGFSTWLSQQDGQRAVIGMAAEYAALAGNRKVEFLDLSWPQIDENTGVIRVKRAKQRGKKRGEVIEHIEITPRIQELLSRLKAIDKGCLYVFPNRSGTHYTQSGFKGMWGKLMNEALRLGKLTRRFTFHDLRAYYVTQHKQERGALPDMHANPETTARVYDRNKIVKRRAL